MYVCKIKNMILNGIFLGELRMQIKIINKLLFLGFAVFCLTGCENLRNFEKWLNEADDVGLTNEMKKEREKNRPGFMISLNEIVKERTTKDIEVMIPSYIYSNQKICINRNGYLSSKNIKKIERIPNKKLANTYDLILYLDMPGMIKYNIIMTSFKGQKMGVLIDGKFYRATVIEKPLNEEQKKIVIRGPFGENVSRKITDKSEVNYKQFNDKSFTKIFKLDQVINPR